MAHFPSRSETRCLASRWIPDGPSNGGPIESSCAGKTENALEPRESHKMLRSHPRSIASRFAGNGTNTMSGGSTVAQAQTRPGMPAEKPEMPIIASGGAGLKVAHRTTNSGQMPRAFRRLVAFVAECGDLSGSSRTTVAETSETARTSKTSMKPVLVQASRCLARTAQTCGNRPSHGGGVLGTELRDTGKSGKGSELSCG